MIVEELHRLIQERWDEATQSQFRELNDVEIDDFINATIHEYVEIFTSGRNDKYDGIEVQRQSLDRVDTLIVGFPEEPGITPTDEGEGIYSFDLTTLVFPFRSLLTAQIDTQNCGLFSVVIEQSGNTNTVTMNTYRKPSKKWRRAPGFLRSDKLYVHTDSLFTPVLLKPVYIRQPAEVCLGTYPIRPTIDNPNPTAIKPKQECDLPGNYHYLLVDMVVQDIFRTYKDVDRKNLLTEKIYNQ